jgi:hypothetical protein
MEYLGEDPSHVAALGPFGALDGHEPHLWGLNVGESLGRSVSLFHFSADHDPRSLKHTVVVLRDPRLSLPEFSLRWVGFFARTPRGKAVVPGTPGLSEHYWLEASGIDTVRALFTPAVKAFFADRPRSNAEGRDGALLLSRGRMCNAVEARQLVTDVLELAELCGESLKARR